jgi:hypothetical protein
MTIHKLSSEELLRYKRIRAGKAGKAIVPDIIAVDDKNRKNIQAMIPVDLWVDFRVKAAQEMTTTNNLMTHALGVYLTLNNDDFKRIKERIDKEIKENESK